MSKVIENLENEFGICIDSVLGAVIQYNDTFRHLDRSANFSKVAEMILGKKVNIMEAPYGRVQIGYIIQESVSRHIDGFGVDVDDVFEVATEKAKRFIKDYRWVFAVKDEEPKLDARGKPKRKKGAKQEEAARIYKELKGGDKKVIIQRFMDDLDMSKAGATTYFYNMRKKFGA